VTTRSDGGDARKTASSKNTAISRCTAVSMTALRKPIKYVHRGSSFERIINGMKVARHLSRSRRELVDFDFVCLHQSCDFRETVLDRRRQKPGLWYIVRQRIVNKRRIPVGEDAYLLRRGNDLSTTYVVGPARPAGAQRKRMGNKREMARSGYCAGSGTYQSSNSFIRRTRPVVACDVSGNTAGQTPTSGMRRNGGTKAHLQTLLSVQGSGFPGAPKRAALKKFSALHSGWYDL